MKERTTFAGAIAVLLGLAVAGCSSGPASPPPRGNPYTEAKDLADAQAGVAKSPSNFTEYLGSEYAALATSLDQQGRTIDAGYFADKSLVAEQGVAVPPEQNTSWAIPLEIPNGFRTQLAQARTRLLAALDGGARTRAPALAARAQARYDCWTEQMEVNWQTAQSGACRSEFLAAMDQLEAKPAAAAAPGNVIGVYFDFNKSSLSREARQTLQQVASQLKANSGATVTLVGKTDLAGTDSYNMALSKRRAEAVRAELVRDGIASSRITVQWTGERQPPVPTPQGVREPRNRVVEIMLH